MKENKKKSNKKVGKSDNKKRVVKEAIKAEKRESKIKSFIKRIYKRNIAISFVIGLAIGLIVMALCTPKRIAKLANGEEAIVTIGNTNITANELYTDIKDQYSDNVLTLLLNKIDNSILTELYPDNNELKTKVNEMADYYISMYESDYGYTEDQFLEANGFATRDEFLDVLSLVYRRNEYYNDYTRNLLTDNEITKYYNENVFGDIEAKYIKVSGTTDEQLSLAKRIIDRLNNGETFEAVVEHYGDRISSENLNTVSYTSNIDAPILKEIKSLSDNSHSKSAVKVNDGYIIVIRYSSKEKASLDDIKESIKDMLVKEKQANDNNLFYNALIALRKEKNVKFNDVEFEKQYNKYVEMNSN